MKHVKITMKTLLFLLYGMRCLSTPEPATADPVYTKTILGLYNSEHGQTAVENEINFYLVKQLKPLGLTVEFYDINKGIPENIENYRAVISWYRAGTMKRPSAYLDFIREVIQSGRKFIVLGSLGAYGDSETGEWLPKAVINRSLSLLGLRYQYEWTDNADVLTIDYIDREMCEYEAAQDVTVSRFYYRFVPADRDLNVYLSLHRNDREYGPSPVIVSNSNGGFALGSYLYHIKDSTLTMLLDLKAFLTASLFPEPSHERIALIVDPSKPVTEKVLYNTETILERAKLEYEVIYQDGLTGMLAEDLNRFTSIGLILRNDTGIEPNFFKPFLKRGGGIVSLLGGNFNTLGEVLPLSPEQESYAVARGYRFSPDFTFGENLALIDRDIPWDASQSRPSQNSDILATDFKGDIPLLWSSRVNEGRVLVWNWNGFQEKVYRGFLLESFLSIRPVAAAGTPGVATMFIDDWPIPMYNVVKDPLTITDTEFYTKKWWPELKSFFTTYDIPHSSYIIFEYNMNTTPPFTIEEFFIGEGQPSTKIGREILESEHELALHGYNHASLILDDRKPGVGYWPDTETMKQGLHAAKEEWIRLFGAHALPRSYVAPNNYISPEGIDAVHEVFPSIHVIGTMNIGGGSQTDSEFGEDSDRPGLYYLPRVSYGYMLNNFLELSISSAIEGYGIWTHFTHADDVYDPYRSRGMSWDEMLQEFHKTVRFVRRHFPWLDYVTVEKAGRIMKAYDNMNAEFRWNSETKTLTVASVPGFRFRVRQNIEGKSGKAASVAGGTVLYRYKNGPFIIVESTEGKCTVTF
jgi:hypothetical protein